MMLILCNCLKFPSSFKKNCTNSNFTSYVLCLFSSIILISDNQYWQVNIIADSHTEKIYWKEKAKQQFAVFTFIDFNKKNLTQCTDIDENPEGVPNTSKECWCYKCTL